MFKGFFMRVKDLYFNQIKRSYEYPERVQKMINLGLFFELHRIKMFSKESSSALKYLNEISLKFIQQTLKNPQNAVWVNLFVPCEIIHAFGLYPLLIENYASFLAGFKIQNIYLDIGDKCGFSDTLCSYHKAFIGAAEGGIAPKPVFAAASSIICDANNSTFGYLANKFKIPYYLLDIPHIKNKASVEYVRSQLKELIEAIEKHSGKKFHMEKLEEVIEIENKTLEFMDSSLSLLRKKHYPKTMTQEMYMLAAVYTYIGTEEVLQFYKKMNEELKSCSLKEKKRLLWVHTLPFPSLPLKDIFEKTGDFEIIAMDLSHPDFNKLKGHDPLTMLSEKMIESQYNGMYRRKISKILKLAETLKVDGVIHFCHLGCRQNAGGRTLLYNALKANGIPSLAIDGDSLDMRNNQQGQMVTRIEAFLEIIRNRKIQKGLY